MSIDSLHAVGEELEHLTPDAFVKLIRDECSKPGRGMKDHPIVQELEAGTVTIPQCNCLRSSSIFISQKCFHGLVRFT